MANPNRMKQIATAIAGVCNDVKAMNTKRVTSLRDNTIQGFDWTDEQEAAPITDGDGYVAGENFTPGEVSNAVGSLDALQAWADVHLNNILKLADP